jgi:hypothetical protein
VQTRVGVTQDRQERHGSSQYRWIQAAALWTARNGQ